MIFNHQKSPNMGLNFSYRQTKSPDKSGLFGFTALFFNRQRNMRIINKDTRALHIFFHELGHFMLAHQAALHHNDSQPCQYEDSEWQADYFADCMMEFLGVRNYKQLPLF